MYGLGSREALSKRQARWVQDVDKDVRSNPAQNVFTREPPSNPVRDKPNIISMLSDEYEQFEPVTDSHRKKPFNNHLMGIIPEETPSTLLAMQSLCDDLQRRCTKLEQEHETLKRSISEKSDLYARIQKLEETSGRLLSLTSTSASIHDPDIDSRLIKLEQVNPGELLSRVAILERSLGGRVSLIPQNSSEFSALTEPDLNTRDTYEFIPYVIKEDYAGRDNLTTLKGPHLEMLVEILNFYSEKLLIYPFGAETRLPQFNQTKLQMPFKDADGIVTGIVYGLFKRGDDNIYVIEVVNFSSGMETATLPLTVTCKVDLTFE